MGACPNCDGLGEIKLYVDPDQASFLTQPKSIEDWLPVKPWSRAGFKRNQFYLQMLHGIASPSITAFQNWTVPFEQIKAANIKHVHSLWFRATTISAFTYHSQNAVPMTGRVRKPFEGVIPNVERRYCETDYGQRFTAR